MPQYLTTLCHADGRTGSVQRTRWWAEDKDAIRAGFRWLRLHVHAAGLVHPHFDRWTVARYDKRGLPIIIAYGGIDDDPDRSVPRHKPSELCDCPNPRPGHPYHCAAV